MLQTVTYITAATPTLPPIIHNKLRLDMDQSIQYSVPIDNKLEYYQYTYTMLSMKSHLRRDMDQSEVHKRLNVAYEA